MISQERANAIHEDLVCTFDATRRQDSPPMDEDTDRYPGIQNASDETLMEVGHVATPDVVVVDTPQELAFAIHAADRLSSLSRSQRAIQRHVTHEVQHDEAAQAVNLWDCKFGLKIGYSTDLERVIWQHPLHLMANGTIPKIALASILVHPSNFLRSPGDGPMARALGYVSTQQIDQRIVAYNRTYDAHLLRPPFIRRWDTWLS